MRTRLNCVPSDSLGLSYQFDTVGKFSVLPSESRMEDYDGRLLCCEIGILLSHGRRLLVVLPFSVFGYFTMNFYYTFVGSHNHSYHFVPTGPHSLSSYVLTCLDIKCFKRSLNGKRGTKFSFWPAVSVHPKTLLYSYPTLKLSCRDRLVRPHPHAH